MKKTHLFATLCMVLCALVVGFSLTGCTFDEKAGVKKALEENIDIYINGSKELYYKNLAEIDRQLIAVGAEPYDHFEACMKVVSYKIENIEVASDGNSATARVVSNAISVGEFGKYMDQKFEESGVTDQSSRDEVAAAIKNAYNAAVAAVKDGTLKPVETTNDVKLVKDHGKWDVADFEGLIDVVMAD